MTFSQVLSILQARWWVALLVLAVTVGTAVAVSLLLPKQYTATARVVVDFKPDPVTAMMYGGMASPAFMATQVDIIKSERVAQRVVRNLKLTENPQVRQQWLEATRARAASKVGWSRPFAEQLDVTPSRESQRHHRVLQGTGPALRGRPGQRLRAGLSSDARSNCASTRPSSTPPSSTAAPRKRAMRSKRRRAACQRFQKDKGIIATDERLDVENARLNELSSQLVMLQALAAESGSRQAQARGGSADRMQEVLNNPLIVGAEGRPVARRGQAAGAEHRLGDNHPQVVEAQANIAELRSKAGCRDPPRHRRRGCQQHHHPPARGRCARGTRGAAQQGAAPEGRARRRRGAAARRGKRPARLRHWCMQRLTQTSLESQTTQSNINLLTQATPPLEAVVAEGAAQHRARRSSSARCWRLAWRWLLELMDRRVRSVDDVAGTLGLPVVGIMPKPNARALMGANKPSLAQQRLMAPLPAPGKGA